MGSEGEKIRDLALSLNLSLSYVLSLYTYICIYIKCFCYAVYTHRGFAILLYLFDVCLKYYKHLKN